jgi:biopolymer transport protein ExbD
MGFRRRAGKSVVGRLGQRRAGGRGREPDLTSLINIVFLILIFFVVAGALRPFSARDVRLAKVAQERAGQVSPGHLIVREDGRLTYRGADVSLEALGELVAGQAAPGSGGKAPAVFTLVADGRLPAKRLLEVSRVLKGAGVGRVALMVERSAR